MTSLTLFTEGEVVEAVDASTLLYAAGVARVGDAATVELAQVTEKLTELRALAGEATGIASDELVRRMDRDGKWTVHEDGYTIKSASPAAGTVSYDLDKLRAALADLVAAGVVSAAGANAAVETVQPKVAVSYGLLRSIKRALADTDDQDAVLAAFDNVRLLLLSEPEPGYKLHAAGVNALLKLPAAREAIESCQVVTDPGRRKAKVTRAA